MFVSFRILSLLSLLLVGSESQTTDLSCNFGTAAANDLTTKLGKPVPQTCVSFEGRQRCFYTYIPDCANGATPLVYDIHGLGNCPAVLASYSGWFEKATSECFIVVWPEGNPRNLAFSDQSCWTVPGGNNLPPAPPNSGDETQPCCCVKNRLQSLQPEQTMDIEFLRHIAELVVQDVSDRTMSAVTVNIRRIYMSGHSNGCIVAHSMGVLHSDLVAAVCCMSGTFLSAPASDYTPTPFWNIHGSLDILIPRQGRYFPGTELGLQIPDVDAATAALGDLNGCSRKTTRTGTLPAMALNGQDGSMITERLTGCDNGATVELVTLTTGGHSTFNTLQERFPSTAASTSIDSTSLAWDFCRSFSSAQDPDGLSALGPTPSPTVPPTTGPISICFSSDTLVQVQGRGAVAMKDLQLHDMVLVRNNRFESVYSFGHYAPHLWTEYRRIHLDDAQLPALEISSSHMLFLHDGTSVAAGMVQVDDVLLNGHRVMKMETITKQGAYAPLTSSGTIVVNGGIVVSSYVSVDNTKQWLTHLFVAPYRLACRLSFALLGVDNYEETYNRDGIATWMEPLLDGTLWWAKQNRLVQYVILLLALPFVLIAAFVETTTRVFFLVV